MKFSNQNSKNPFINPSRNQKLLYLEGVRGLAAFIVVLFHLVGFFDYFLSYKLLVQLKAITHSYYISHVLQGFISFFFDGNLAVYIFWFMSAYVISIKLFDDSQKNYLFRSFAKRYFRLMIPVLGSVLFAYSLHYQGFMYNTVVAQYLGEAYTQKWSGQYYTFQPGLLDAIKFGLWDAFFMDLDLEHTYNIVLWTMKPEFLGSMCCLMLFGVVGQSPYRYYFYIIFALIAFLIGNYWLVSFLLGLLLSDIDFGSNTKIKIRFNSLFKHTWLNLLIFLLLLTLGGKIKNYGYYNVFISASIVLIITRTKILQSIFEWNILVWLGKISFSLYLLHFPIICSLGCYLYLVLPLDHYSRYLVVGTVSLVFSIIMAYIFTKYIDQQGIKFANYVGDILTRKNS